MLENSSIGLKRAEIERIVRNQYSRLLKQQQDSKALSASKGTTSVDRGEKNRRPCNQFKSNYFNCGRKGRRAEDCRSAKKKIEKSGGALPTRRAEGGESSTFVEVRSTLRINAVACTEAWSTGLAIVKSEELRRV